MDINFIKSVSPGQHKKIRSWMLISSILLVSALLLLVIIGAMQCMHWYTASRAQRHIQEQVKQFNQLTSEHKKLVAEEAGLKKQLAKINNHLHNKKNPSDILKAVKLFLKGGTSLEHAVYSSASAEIKITAHDVKTIMHISKQLPALFTDNQKMRVSSLEYKDALVTAVLKNDQATIL